jgi:hypothetical protein
MADRAAHLVDRVLPKVPVRQWVVSLPFVVGIAIAAVTKVRGSHPGFAVG